MAVVQKITPNLWFDKNAEEAVNFYVSIFKNSTIGRISRYTKEGFEFHQMPEGSVMTIEFALEAEKFVALNGGPVFKFNEAISFIINCSNQEEIDYYWDKLSDGGEIQQCGWLKDKFGLSWQVVPSMLSEMFLDSSEKGTKAMRALLQMKKLDIKQLQQAYDS